MPKILNYSIVGLEDYTIGFNDYCSLCEIQQFCKWGKDEPFSINISCGDLNRAKEKVKFEQLQKLQKTEDVSVSYEELVKKVKINLQGIISLSLLTLHTKLKHLQFSVIFEVVRI